MAIYSAPGRTHGLVTGLQNHPILPLRLPIFPLAGMSTIAELPSTSQNAAVVSPLTVRFRAAAPFHLGARSGGRQGKPHSLRGRKLAGTSRRHGSRGAAVPFRSTGRGDHQGSGHERRKADVRHGNGRRGAGWENRRKGRLRQSSRGEKWPGGVEEHRSEERLERWNDTASGPSSPIFCKNLSFTCISRYSTPLLPNARVKASWYIWTTTSPKPCGAATLATEILGSATGTSTPIIGSEAGPSWQTM
jgi:hypothetical protein